MAMPLIAARQKSDGMFCLNALMNRLFSREPESDWLRVMKSIGSLFRPNASASTYEKDITPMRCASTNRTTLSCPSTVLSCAVTSRIESATPPTTSRQSSSPLPSAMASR